MARLRSLDPAMVVRIHPGQWHPLPLLPPIRFITGSPASRPRGPTRSLLEEPSKMLTTKSAFRVLTAVFALGLVACGGGAAAAAADSTDTATPPPVATL